MRKGDRRHVKHGACHLFYYFVVACVFILRRSLPRIKIKRKAIPAGTSAHVKVWTIELDRTSVILSRICGGM